MPAAHSDKINAPIYDPELFEKIYMQVRKAEKRLYSDHELRNLPHVAPDHPHSGEWEQRKASCERFIKHLDKKGKPLSILEIGCGNGWFSAQLAQNSTWKVVGIDINKEELAQAARVFNNRPNLEFIPGDIRTVQFKYKDFDVIVFASSVQYFSSLVGIVNTAFNYLKDDGEIHILDSALYRESELDEARKRTKKYYTGMGFPEAASYYFHHSMKELKDFKINILYNPRSWINRFRKNKSHFYWICLKKQ